MNSITYHQFLKLKNDFSLGKLTTEGFHPITKNLSHFATSNLPHAIDLLQEVDRKALQTLKLYFQDIEKLRLAVSKTLDSGNKVYICGCGATGRLALSCEFLFRQEHKTDSVISFMAGGDYALIKSVESFEDRMSYGSRQLLELGFKDGDLLLAVTEGGETSFVIGAAKAAATESHNAPYFIYCNPDEELKEVTRSQEVLEDTNIQKINLTIGQMAISGSTRMQATTVQMICCGMALVDYKLKASEFKHKFDELIESLVALDYKILEDLIIEESKVYQEGGIVSYLVDEELAICVLTDTTERAPTFSLAPFEQELEPYFSLCYLTVRGKDESAEAWKSILGRDPRCLSWSNIEFNLSENELFQFDISEKSLVRRSKNSNHQVFQVELKNDVLHFKLNTVELSLSSPESLLSKHLITKLLLNSLSTLVMCRMGRVESNVMTWVKPSNMKLVDRAVRYVKELSPEEISYDDVLVEFFDQVEVLKDNESIVLKTLESLSRK